MSQSQQSSPQERISVAAARLRALQSSCASLGAEARNQHLQNELDHLLNDIPGAEQEQYLQGLQEFFPDEYLCSPEEKVVEKCSDEELIANLSARFQQAGEEDRDVLFAKIDDLRKQYGHSDPLLAGTSDDVVAELLSINSQEIANLRLILTVLRREKLGLVGTEPFDLVNCMRLLTLFTDRYPKLHEVFHCIWKASGENESAELSETDFRKQLASYLLGDQSVSGGDLFTVVEKTSQLMAAFLSAMPDAGRELAADILKELAPETIAAHVRQHERSSLGLESKYWKEYEYRCQDFTEDRLVEKLIKLLTKKTRSLVG